MRAARSTGCSFKEVAMREYRNTIPHSQEILALTGLENLYPIGMAKKIDEKKPDYSAFVLAARKALHLTQQQLGERMGRTKGNISGWEKDRHKPSLYQLQQLSEWSKLPIPGLSAPSPATLANVVLESPEVSKLIVAFGWLTKVQKKDVLKDLVAKAETNKTISKELGPRWEFTPDAVLHQAGIRAAPLIGPTKKKHKQPESGRPPSAPLDDYPES